MVNGTSRCNGKVEIYRDGHWKRACNTDWTKNEEHVLCSEINCGTAALERGNENFGETLAAGGFKTVCTGNETSIGQCTTEEITENCMDASVSCTSKLQFSSFAHKYCMTSKPLTQIC